MEKFEKILELFDKKSLTEAETKLLSDFADSDEELKSFVEVYKSLNSSLDASQHLPVDLLSTYILFEMGDEPDNKLILLLRDKIKSHLHECSLCKAEYNLLRSEYQGIDNHINKSIITDSPSDTKQSNLIKNILFTRLTNFRYAFAALTILIVGYVGLFVISSSVTPDYKMNLFNNDHDDLFKTRGRTSILFQQGINSIENGDYNDAIKYLSEDIIEHQNEKSIFYAYYILGITYLKASESEFLGLFKSYDEESIKLSISNFNESIIKNNSGDYESLKLDAYYYVGRGYLLNDSQDSAKANLNRVIEGNGRFSKQSAELIEQMENN